MEDEPEKGYRSPNKPYLRLYEAEEYRLWIEGAASADRSRPPPVTLDANESQSGFRDPDCYRMYHMRFFETYINDLSVQGYLDLTGRHAKRLDALLSLYDDFKADMARVRETTRVVHYEETGWRGQVRPCVTHEMLDVELWKEIRLKWKIPRVFTFSLLTLNQDRLTEVMSNAGNKPKFQKLCLSDLPPELINEIFRHASLCDARLLSATSKHMHAIGMRYLYHTRTLQFGFSDILQVYAGSPFRTELQGDDRVAFFSDLASRRRSHLVDETNFLLSRPDLIDPLQTLILFDGWSFSQRVWDENFALDHDFYAPVYLALNSVLQACKNLVNLEIGQFIITADWLCTISLLPSLFHIKFRGSIINDPSVETAIYDGSIPSSPQVVSLDVYEGWNLNDPTREWDGGGLWFTILLFPNLMTLNHHNLHDARNPASIPQPFIRQRSTILSSSLCRLALDNISSWQIPHLSDWFNLHCNFATPCTLTHFKLRTNRWVGDDILVRLLESLRSAPLQVLVLEGLKDGSVTLIHRIAELFPDLIGLTLIRRENYCQHDLKKVTWPHQSGEYAVAFANFRKLRYFGWNFRVPRYDVTPSPLVLFEDLADGKVFDDKDLYFREDDAYFADTEMLALPFAAYCPTLELMMLESQFFYASVSRGPRGEIVVSGSKDGALKDPQEWNPSFFESGWTPVVPSSSKEANEVL
ncbi:hypothetical protein D9758_011614 [Tetrapyrgos nigripes]|uniref:F-box domain-containing protein n=1 Tax=Tetrapyrgos nigripes TaxID=182062 RepID=A0A8H5FS29_9AGAR|nr:hypothetical protein D9758_011614 [Tetrapyrgos nigripes]